MDTVYPAPSITYVSEDAPLIVNSASSQMYYDTIFMDFDGYIEISVGSKFQINKLVKWDDNIALPEGCLKCPPKEAGELKRTNSQYHIMLTGTPGENGKRGADGASFGDSGFPDTAGSLGGNAPGTFTLIINDLQFDTAILSTGGNGGDGGDGGNGAAGYDGESAEKPGGIGGDGGNGGSERTRQFYRRRRGTRTA